MKKNLLSIYFRYRTVKYLYVIKQIINTLKYMLTI